MTPPPEPSYLSPRWCDRDWTPFVPFAAARGEMRAIPTGPGLYRVRVAGRGQLAYVGQTRGLRERVGMLAGPDGAGGICATTNPTALAGRESRRCR